MDLASVLKPSPMDVLPHLLAAHHNASEEQRAGVAAHSWNEVGDRRSTVEDMEVLYEQLSAAYPVLLVKVHVPRVKEARSLAAAYPDVCPCGEPVTFKKERSGELWSLTDEPTDVKVPQGEVFEMRPTLRWQLEL